MKDKGVVVCSRSRVLDYLYVTLLWMPASVHCQSVDFYRASENRMRIRVRVEGDPYPGKYQIFDHVEDNLVIVLEISP